MSESLAFVLGGGGARGAMQVGAIRALLEAGYQPDLLVGTSIGAINAAYLALWGMNLDGVVALERAYQDLAEAHLMDTHLGLMAPRALLDGLHHRASQRAREYFIASGISPDWRFEQVKNVRLALVGADLDSGWPVIYGEDPSQSILDGLLASIALPPWFGPVEKNGQYIIDGGAVSNLPIEPALRMGATEIIALDLNYPVTLPGNTRGPSQFVEKLGFGITQRQVYLEASLAEARGVPVHFMALRSDSSTPIWDFSNHARLIRTGYEIANQRIAQWPGNQSDRHVSGLHISKPVI
jgi:NTE family protein